MPRRSCGGLACCKRCRGGGGGGVVFCRVVPLVTLVLLEIVVVAVCVTIDTDADGEAHDAGVLRATRAMLSLNALAVSTAYVNALYAVRSASKFLRPRYVENTPSYMYRPPVSDWAFSLAQVALVAPVLHAAFVASRLLHADPAFAFLWCLIVTLSTALHVASVLSDMSRSYFLRLAAVVFMGPSALALFVAVERSTHEGVAPGAELIVVVASLMNCAVLVFNAPRALHDTYEYARRVILLSSRSGGVYAERKPPSVTRSAVSAFARRMKRSWKKATRRHRSDDVVVSPHISRPAAGVAYTEEEPYVAEKRNAAYRVLETNSGSERMYEKRLSSSSLDDTYVRHRAKFSIGAEDDDDDDDDASASSTTQELECVPAADEAL